MALEALCGIMRWPGPRMLSRGGQRMPDCGTLSWRAQMICRSTIEMLLGRAGGKLKVMSYCVGHL